MTVVVVVHDDGTWSVFAPTAATEEQLRSEYSWEEILTEEAEQ